MRASGSHGLPQLKSRRLGRHDQLRAAASNSPALRRGSSGAGVAELQSLLADLGLPLKTSLAKGRADGIFGPETESAVKAFQRRSNLVADGIAGRATISALDDIVASNPMLEAPSSEAERAALARGLSSPISRSSSAYW